MSPQQLEKLIQGYINGTLSAHEMATLRTVLLNSNDDDEELIKLFDSVWDKNNGLDLPKEKAESILQSILSVKKERTRNYKWIGIAASLAIIVAAVIAFNSYSPQKSKTVNDNIVSENADVILPGKNKAILTLSNGKKISLNEQGTGELAREAGVIVSKVKDGQLNYTLSDKQNNEFLQFNMVSTPIGGQYMVVLPDGTKVWLNAHSSLRYPVQFIGKERIVEIDGEAYFEVAKNKLMPFKVIGKNLTIKVFGTHFNVTAYTDEHTVRTTLLEGAVNVNNKILLPGEQARINNDDKKINISKVNTDEVVAWKNGLFIFRNEDIESIMKKVSRWYDVEFIIKDKQLLNERFGGTFSRSVDLNDMLESISLTGLVQFKIEGRKIIVMK